MLISFSRGDLLFIKANNRVYRAKIDDFGDLILIKEVGKNGR